MPTSHARKHSGGPGIVTNADVATYGLGWHCADYGGYHRGGRQPAADQCRWQRNCRRKSSIHRGPSVQETDANSTLDCSNECAENTDECRAGSAMTSAPESLVIYV